MKPAGCAFFITATTALTVYHDANPAVGQELLGQRFDPTEGTRQGDILRFITLKVDPVLDVVILRLAEGQAPAKHFLSIPPPTPAQSLLGRHAVVIGLGIPTAKHAPEMPEDLLVGLSWHPIDIFRVGQRHFAYPGTFGPGDSGSALVIADTQVLGMHLAGWNYSASDVQSALDSLVEEDEASEAPAAAGAGLGAYGGGDAGLKRRRADDRAIAVTGTDATESVVRSFAHLSSNLNAGG